MTPHATITEELVNQEEQDCGSTKFTVTESSHNYSYNVSSNWLGDVLEQLQIIASLPDGWDSHGAPSPDIRKVEAAGAVIIYLLHDDPKLPKPHVNPTRNGGVQFEWEAGPRYFEIEIVGERAATYLFCDDVEHVEKTGAIFEGESFDDMLNYIQSVGNAD